MDTAPIRSSVVFLISTSMFAGCMHRAPSLMMLEERADYKDMEAEEAGSLQLSAGGAISPLDGGVPVRRPPRTANIWICPHETPAKEFFWGGWITIVIEGDRWELMRPKRLGAEGMPPDSTTLDQKGKK